MKTLHVAAFILLVIGGLNWLLAIVGADIMQWSTASVWQVLVKIVYLLVGASAVYEIFTHKRNCKVCEKTVSSPQSAV